MDSDAFLMAVAQALPTLTIALAIELDFGARRALDRESRAGNGPAFAAQAIRGIRAIGLVFGIGEAAALSGLLFDNLPPPVELTLTATAALATLAAIVTLVNAPVRRIREALLDPPGPPAP